MMRKLGASGVGKRSLAARKPDQKDRSNGQLDPTRLASNVLAELRDLSTGLVLPEIESLSLEQALRLAVERGDGGRDAI
jgi:hypothetical protein